MIRRLAILSCVACTDPVVVAETEPGWQQVSYVKSPRTHVGDEFGKSLAVEQSRIIVGLPGSGTDGSGFDVDPEGFGTSATGAIAIFEGAEPGILAKSLESANGDNFGNKVAIDEDTIVVGAPNQETDGITNGGAAFIIEWSSEWRLTTELRASSPTQGGSFGGAVAISSPHVLIGSVGGTGRAFVFARGGEWTQQAELTALAGDNRDEMGKSVAIDRDVAVIGAPKEASCASTVDGDPEDDGCPGAGAAYVFERRGESWELTAYLKSSTSSAGAFGTSCAVSGDRIAIGAPNEGAVHLFTRAGDGWRFEDRIVPTDPVAPRSFGWSIAMGEDRIAIGAPSDGGCGGGVPTAPGVPDCEIEGEGPGAVYLFARTSEQWVPSLYLEASNGVANAGFGYAVAIDGQRIIASAPSEQGCATNFDGDPQDLLCATAGAVYVFEYVEAQ